MLFIAFSAVCTTFTLHCAVALLIGSVHLICLCESRGHVVYLFLHLHASINIIIIIIIIILLLLLLLFNSTSQFFRPFIGRFPAGGNGRRPSVCLPPPAEFFLSS